ncbi:MAG: PQQ-dependent sugar dehydrogenase [Candidatus Levybacteria bacterium]|nr:PQQ-dependent sugar dehydrogenase [Candidatus Levybacteria bacterium]
MTKIIVGVGVLLIVALAILSTTDFARPQKPQDIKTTGPISEQTPAISMFAENLEVPWAMDFLPDGRMLVTERPGRVSVIDKNGQVSQIANINVRTVSESGLHGVAVDPEFDSYSYIYLYYTYSDDGNNTLNRVARYKFENNNLREDKIIVDRIPGASNHDGGRIKFGPDNFLYITTGDAQEPSLAQDRDSLAGKILRVTRDGDPVPGNSFATRIYSYGHRNPQGITWDDSNRLWETEHGSSATDELNLIMPGKNYGWPEIRGDQTRTGMVSPVTQSGNQTWAPGGAAFLNGSIFFTGLRGSALYEYKINEKRLGEHFKNEYGRLRDVVAGPDNLLYVTTSNRDGRGNPRSGDDKILRINPTKL